MGELIKDIKGKLQ